jgi:hypothetical protein
MDYCGWTRRINFISLKTALHQINLRVHLQKLLQRSLQALHFFACKRELVHNLSRKNAKKINKKIKKKYLFFLFGRAYDGNKSLQSNFMILRLVQSRNLVLKHSLVSNKLGVFLRHGQQHKNEQNGSFFCKNLFKIGKPFKKTRSISTKQPSNINSSTREQTTLSSRCRLDTEQLLAPVSLPLQRQSLQCHWHTRCTQFANEQEPGFCKQKKKSEREDNKQRSPSPLDELLQRRAQEELWPRQMED